MHRQALETERRGSRPPPRKIEKIIFLGKYHVKFGHFVNFHIQFSGKNVLPPKLTELLYAYVWGHFFREGILSRWDFVRFPVNPGIWSVCRGSGAWLALPRTSRLVPAISIDSHVRPVFLCGPFMLVYTRTATHSRHA